MREGWREGEGGEEEGKAKCVCEKRTNNINEFFLKMHLWCPLCLKKVFLVNPLCVLTEKPLDLSITYKSHSEVDACAK